MSSSSEPANAPENAPLQSLSSDNRGPWVVVCAYIFLILSVITIFIKLLTRFKATNRLTANDLYILLSASLATAQTAVITVSVHNGLGRPQENLTESNFDAFQRTFYAAQILQIMALAAAKASVTHLIIAINPTRGLLLSCYGLLAFIAAWMVAGVLAVAFQCSLPNPWDVVGNDCVDQFAMNAGVNALNILTDLVIIIIPILMMSKVQVSSSKRFVVTGLFATRIVVPAFTIAYLHSLNHLYRSDDPDMSWNAVLPEVWSIILLHSSIVTACIPSLKPFLADMKPGLIVVNVPENDLTASFVRHTTKSRSDQTGTRKTGGVSRLASRLGLSTAGQSVNSNSNISYWGEKQDRLQISMEMGHNRPNATKASSKVEMDRSESVKGLTDDVILHTIDYKVEFEDPADRDDPSLSRSVSGSPRRGSR